MRHLLTDPSVEEANGLPIKDIQEYQRDAFWRISLGKTERQTCPEPAAQK